MPYTTVATHPKYEFRLDKANHSLIAVVRGYYSDEDAKAFAIDYEKIVSKITPSDFELVIECGDMETSEPSMLEALSNVFKMYEQTGFHTIKVVESSSKVATMQLKSAVKKSGVAVTYLKDLPQ